MARQLPIAVDLAPAEVHYRHCLLCEHRWGRGSRCWRARRMQGRHHTTAVSPSHRISEEAELIPSHLFYLSGCDLRGAFCIAEANAFDPNRGSVLDGETFNRTVAWGGCGAKNIQWVGGEPTIHVPAPLRLMSDCPELPPVVWKSDFYGTPAALELLDPWVTTFVADFKFGNDALCPADRWSASLSGSRDAESAATAERLIVRHLLLPGHFECCYRPIVAWLAERLPDVRFSLRDGFLPRWQAHRHAELGRTLSQGEGEPKPERWQSRQD